MDRPIKNLLSAHACHSLNVFASWAVVSFCTSSCLSLHPSSFLCKFCLFYCLPVALPVWLIVCFYVCTYLSFFFSSVDSVEHQCCVRLCITTFFFLCPTSSFCSVPSSSLPVLIWKCFGLQWMMVNIEEIKRPYGPLNGPSKYPFKQPNNYSVKISTKSSRLYMQWWVSLRWMIWIMKPSCAIVVVFYACLLGVNYQQC